MELSICLPGELDLQGSGSPHQSSAHLTESFRGLALRIGGLETPHCSGLVLVWGLVLMGRLTVRAGLCPGCISEAPTSLTCVKNKCFPFSALSLPRTLSRPWERPSGIRRPSSVEVWLSAFWAHMWFWPQLLWWQISSNCQFWGVIYWLKTEYGAFRASWQR